MSAAICLAGVAVLRRRSVRRAVTVAISDPAGLAGPASLAAAAAVLQRGLMRIRYP